MTKNLADELQRTARQALSGLHPAPQGEEAGGLPFRKLLAAAFRARYLVFATTLFGVLVGSFLAITSANSYVSTGKFLFTASGAESKRFDPTGAYDTTQETIGTAASYILNTDGLLSRVVDRLTPARILAPYKPGNPGDSAAKAFFFMIQRDWNATREEERTPEEALKHLRKTILVERPRYTDVLVATCTANDPKLAQEILAVYMEEAIKWHIEQYEEKSAYDAAEKRATETDLALAAVRRSLRDFLDRKVGHPDFDDEMKRLKADDIEAAARVTKLTDDLAIAQGLAALYTRLLEGDNAIKPTRTVKKKIDKTTQTLVGLQEARTKEEVAKAVLVRSGAKTGDPRLADADLAIANIKSAMELVLAEAKDAPLEEVVEDNPAYIEAVNARLKVQKEIDEIKTRLAQAVEIRIANTSRLKVLHDLEPEYEKLNNTQLQAEFNSKAAQINWLAAQQKQELSRGNFSSLKAFEQASLPLEKEGPNRGKLLLGGLLVGLFLGLGVVILRALPDTTVRTRNDLETIDGIQVIGVMPRLDARNLKRHVYLRGQGW
jgi:uncharacterized protein involved in exopolysaccharide biosynthesis